MVVFGTSVSKWLALAALGPCCGSLAACCRRSSSPASWRTSSVRWWTSSRRGPGAAGVGRPGGVLRRAGRGRRAVWLAGARLNAELRDISREGPSIIESVVDRLTGGQDIDLLGQTITSRELGRRLDIALRDELGTPSQAIQAVRVGFELTLAVLLVFLSLAYLLIDGHSFWRYVLRFVPPEHRPHVEHLAAEIHRVLGRLSARALVLIVLMSTVTFVVLEWAFHLPYALWIGILTGILEIIPLIGPITAGAIACTVGFSQGGPTEAAGAGDHVRHSAPGRGSAGHAADRRPRGARSPAGDDLRRAHRRAGRRHPGHDLAVPIAAAIKVVLDYAYPGPALALNATSEVYESAHEVRPRLVAP